MPRVDKGALWDVLHSKGKQNGLKDEKMLNLTIIKKKQIK